MRGLVASLIWLGTLSILAAQLLGVAAVLNVAAGFSLLTGCAIGALVTVSYFTAGGLLSSAWVNLVQLIGDPRWFRGGGAVRRSRCWWMGRVVGRSRFSDERVDQHRPGVGLAAAVPARPRVHRLAGAAAESVWGP